MSLAENTPLLQPPVNVPVVFRWPDYCWIIPPLFTNIFLSNFENTIAASIQNPIGSSFGAGQNVAWIATSYLIVSTAVQPLYGRFSGLFGRSPVYFFASGTFSVGCIGCGFSQNLPQLIAARAFCGIGGAGLITVSQIIAYDFLPVKYRGLYQAMSNTCYGLGGALGASVGGVIAESLGWRYAFFLQVPICLFSLFVYLLKARKRLDQFGIPKKPADLKLGDIDILGSLLLMSSITFLLLAVNLGGNEIYWSHSLIFAFFASSGVLLFAFILHERRCHLPVLPLPLFHGREMLAHLGANFFGAAAVFATFYLLPTFFQTKLQNSVSQSSSRLIYPTLSLPIGSIATGLLINIVSGTLTQTLSVLGALVLFFGTSMDLILQFETAVGRSSLWYMVHISWTNLGMGILFPASLIHISGQKAKTHDQAITTSLIFLTRQLGTVFGISISQSVLQNILARALARTIQGKDAAYIIEKIRNDIEVIAHLPPELKSQAIACFAQALQWAFGFCVACGFCAFFSILFASSWVDRRSR